MIKYYSPCISVCSIQAGICTGCRRKVKEIDAWTGLNKHDKLEILERMNADKTVESPRIKQVTEELREDIRREMA